MAIFGASPSTAALSHYITIKFILQFPDQMPFFIQAFHQLRIYDSSVDAALRIIDILKKKGFEFVTADEMIMD